MQNDVRLIDANALPNFKCKVTATVGDQKGPAEMRIVFWQDIEKAPTIDAVPVVHGRWVLGVPITCSVCGKPAAEHDSPITFWESPYCPWCGAKMDGGAE